MSNLLGYLLGNYRLIHYLGEGGFAEVYLGEHLHLNTLAAIKVHRTRLSEKDMGQFRDEARTVAHLDHPNIVRVLDFGTEGETPFLVMAYAPNGTLRQRHPKGSIIPLAVIVSYIRQVAAALQYAHAQKLVHRDVKPENMLLGSRNEVLLSDFGVVAIAHSTSSLRTQAYSGTVHYSAPEQIAGKPRPASDQYALGIIVYEWLTGTRPFSGDIPQLIYQHSFAPPPPLRERLPEIPPQVEYVVQTALAKAPEQRFASVQAFATALEEASRQMHRINPLNLSLSFTGTGAPSPLPPAQSQAVPRSLQPPSTPHLPIDSPLSPPSTFIQSLPSNQPLLTASPSPHLSETFPSFHQKQIRVKKQQHRGFGKAMLLIGAVIIVILSSAGLFYLWTSSDTTQGPHKPSPTPSVTVHSSNLLTVNILSGSRLEQIAQEIVAAKLPGFNASDFLKYTKHPDQFPDKANYPILACIPSGDSMEGLLFPDTYLIPPNGDARYMVNKMLGEFESMVQTYHLDTMAQQNLAPAPGSNPTCSRQLYSVYQMAILASIIEREVIFDADRPGVAGVYWNRVYISGNETAGFLDADPTVQYARDSQPGTKVYWTPLNDKAMNIAPNSPWNTYTNKYWPPTPICSPSLADLQAAANPPHNSGYLYFLAKKDGHIIFAMTYQEFLQDEQQYLQS